MILYYLTYKLFILKHYHTDSESNQHLHINCDGNGGGGGGDSGEDSGEDEDSGEEGGGHCEDLNESCSYFHTHIPFHYAYSESKQHFTLSAVTTEERRLPVDDYSGYIYM